MRLRVTLVLALLLFGGSAQARLEITISGGSEGALPIAVANFTWGGSGEAPEDLSAIIRADLARSGRLAPLPREQMLPLGAPGTAIDFSRWRGLGGDNLVVGRVVPRDGGYQVQFQLFDLLRGRQLTGYSIPFAAGQGRQVAHKISDIVYRELTGEPGAFATHIAYVTVERRGQQPIYRLAVADADGYNEQIILTSKQPLLSPAWAPDGGRFAYVSFENGRSEVYVQDVKTGKREAVASYKGLNSAPAWSPDGTRLALTLSRDGNAEVYILRLADRQLLRVSRSPAIDTEANWAPDGRSLLFTSDRGGKPQLYRVEIGERGVVGRPRRLTFEGSYNARGVFSPDGKRIALVHGVEGAYRIAILELASGELRVVTSSRLDESPSFAANGSMIIYGTELRGRGVLAAVSVDGRIQQQLSLGSADVREPAWSPLVNR